MLVNSVFFLFFFFNQSTSFSIVTCLTLTETAECPLIQLIFSYSFFFGAEIYKLKIFKNVSFEKMITCKIFKNLPLAKVSTPEVRFSTSRILVHAKISTLKVL